MKICVEISINVVLKVSSKPKFKMSSVPEKPWSVHQFEQFRPHMASWVSREVTPHLSLNNFTVRRLLIHGQVKVGKREIVEYISQRDAGDPYRIHIFISAFHRKADESQREELEKHNVKVFSVFSKKKQQEAIEFIEDQLIPDIRVIIHWDECDYGTGERQTLAQIYQHFRNHEQVFNILYSATPEELLYSSEIEGTANGNDTFVADFYEDGIVRRYEPPIGYCGAAEFLRENLVVDAMPFFESTSPNSYVLSDQAICILAEAKRHLKETNKVIRLLATELEDAEDAEVVDEELVNSLKSRLNSIKVRNIIILRISYKNGDDDDDDDSDAGSDDSGSYKAIYPFLKYSRHIDELKDVAIFADKHDVKDLASLENVDCSTIKWGKRVFWRDLCKDKVVLVVHDQTSTRSTEWVFHDRLFATHDYRKRITFNTVAQAQLRPAHYSQNYGSFQRIRIYGHLKTFQLCAGQITASDYLMNEWIVRKIPKSHPPSYRLKNILNPKQLLPERLGGDLPLDIGYPHEVAQRMLIILGCTNNGDTKMSQRVRGQCKVTPVIRSKFYPVENPLQVKLVTDRISADTDPNIFRYVNGHKFNHKNLFRPDLKDSDGNWKGTLRGNRVFEYDTIKNEVWGLRLGKEGVRLTVCYDRGQLGLCLRVATEEYRQVNDLEAYKSMYCLDV